MGPSRKSNGHDVRLKLEAAIATAAKEQAGKETGRGNKKGSTNSSNPLDTQKELAEVAGGNTMLQADSLNQNTL
jgi:hypothetical protein